MNQPAYLVTVQIAVAANNESEAADAITGALTEQLQLGGHIIDWRYTGSQLTKSELTTEDFEKPNFTWSSHEPYEHIDLEKIKGCFRLNINRDVIFAVIGRMWTGEVRPSEYEALLKFLETPRAIVDGSELAELYKAIRIHFGNEFASYYNL
jgi:hypothetical protein